MKDACVESCLQQTNAKSPHRRQLGHHRHLSEANTTTTVRVGLPTWSMDSMDLFSRCMQKHCSATEPTKYNPEVRLPMDDMIFLLHRKLKQKVQSNSYLFIIVSDVCIVQQTFFFFMFCSGRW